MPIRREMDRAGDPRSNMFTIKDSGEREQQGQMVRDTEIGKPDFTNLVQWFEPMGTRYAQHMTKGRTKYPDIDGVPNWTLTPITAEQEARFRRSAARHFKQWLAGETDEDHAAAVLFNINGAEYVRERLDRDDSDTGGEDEAVGSFEDSLAMANQRINPRPVFGAYPSLVGVLYGPED